MLDHIPEDKNHPEVREAILEVLYDADEPLSLYDLNLSVKPCIGSGGISEAERVEAMNQVRRSVSALKNFLGYIRGGAGFTITCDGKAAMPRRPPRRRFRITSSCTAREHERPPHNSLCYPDP
jgi:hypothetical protein